MSFNSPLWCPKLIVDLSHKLKLNKLYKTINSRFHTKLMSVHNSRDAGQMVFFFFYPDRNVSWVVSGGTLGHFNRCRTAANIRAAEGGFGAAGLRLHSRCTPGRIKARRPV